MRLRKLLHIFTLVLYKKYSLIHTRIKPETHAFPLVIIHMKCAWAKIVGSQHATASYSFPDIRNDVEKYLINTHKYGKVCIYTRFNIGGI